MTQPAKVSMDLKVTEASGAPRVDAPPPNPVKALLLSRKVMLAALGVVNTLVSHYLDIPTDVWVSIDALLVVLIASIAYEDSHR